MRGWPSPSPSLPYTCIREQRFSPPGEHAAHNWEGCLLTPAQGSHFDVFPTRVAAAAAAEARAYAFPTPIAGYAPLLVDWFAESESVARRAIDRVYRRL